jgi:hypothetical protein
MQFQESSEASNHYIVTPRWWQYTCIIIFTVPRSFRFRRLTLGVNAAAFDWMAGSDTLIPWRVDVPHFKNTRLQLDSFVVRISAYTNPTRVSLWIACMPLFRRRRNASVYTPLVKM